MEIQFPYSCPRCGARGELSVDAMSSDGQGDGVEATQRDLRRLRPVLRCPGCGKRPRAGMAGAVAGMVACVLVAVPIAYFGHTFASVAMALCAILGILSESERVKRAGRITAIRLAAAIPEARALALPAAPPPSPAPEPGAAPLMLSDEPPVS